MGVSIFFRLFGPRFDLKIKEGGEGSFPGSTTVIHSTSPQLRAIFHAIEKDKIKVNRWHVPGIDMMNNEVKARIHNQ